MRRSATPTTIPGRLALLRVRLVRSIPAVLVTVAGCGGGNPVAPPPPPPPVATISVKPLQAIVTTGERVVAVASPLTATGGPATATVEWRTNDGAVATVGTDGAIVAVGDGTTTITASVGAVSASLEVRVAPPGLARIVDSVRRAYDLPAMGGAIVTNAGTTALAVAGTRRASGGPFVTVDDKWHIGSNLKAITAALAATEVDEGTLDWSTTLAQGLPDLATTMRAEYRDVTLADVLSHRGGIRNDPPPTAFGGTTARQQRESLVAWALTAPPFGPVGGYYYSNLGYLLAAALIERASDTSYEDLLTDRLLGPLGVLGFGWGPQAAAGANDQPVAHLLQNNRWVPCEGCDNPPGLSAAGRAHLPLADWARLIAEMLRADAGTSTLIEPATGRALFTPRVPVTGTDGYGLGWVLVTRGWAGGRAAAHDGSNTVNHSVAWLGLGRGIGFIAVTNAADLATGRTGRALDALVGRMIGYHDTGR